MLCSITANDHLHVFVVTKAGDLVPGSHAAGTGLSVRHHHQRP